MKFRLVFLLLILVFALVIDETFARKSLSSSRLSSRSSFGYRSSSRSGSSSRGHSGSHSTSHSGSHSTSQSGSNSPSQTGSHLPSHNGNYGNSGTSSTGRGAPSAPSSHQQNKDLSTSLLHAEGGGATRPAYPKQPGLPASNPHAPSAPPASTNVGSHSGSPYGALPPYQPGKTPLEHTPKVTAGATQNQAPTSFGQPSGPYNPSQSNPPWSNPYLGSSQPPRPGFNDHSSAASPPSMGFNPNSRYPPTLGSNPPYPVNTPNHPHPMPTGSANPPYPVHGSSPPYPVHGSNSPYPVQHASAPYPVGSTPFGHSGYHPGGSSIPGFAPPPNTFGQPHTPPLGNPYSTYHTGSPFSAPGQPHYSSPQVLSQPAAQPFVPGQTVIMMPNQQDSGRGLGQIFKEALVFSTVNAAVNRVINPHHHYVPESRPVDGAGGTTTHITYNNQYYNTYPGANGTVDGVPQAGAVPSVPINSPSPGIGGVSSVPGSTSSVFPSSVGSISPGIVAAGTPPVTAAGVVTENSSGIQRNQTNQGQPEVPGNATSVPMNMPQYRVSDDELSRISEELFAKQAVNLSKYIKVNLQNHSNSQFSNVTDEALEPLFMVQPELYDYPSVYVTRALYDNYEFDSGKKENRTVEKRKEENLLIDTFLETNVMSRAMQWLAEQRFIYPDDFERKDILRHVWFNQFDGSTSGFERVFAAEKYGDTNLLGVQDWLYFEYEEARKRINYLGYVDKLDLGDNASLLKLNFKMDGIIRPNATIFVGTLPELEMSLYTICFYARPNNLCPVSLGGVKFNIFTHAFRYFGNDLIDLGLPMF